MEKGNRKALAEYCGICWHELRTMPDRYKCSCGEIFHLKELTEAEMHCDHNNRTFTAPTDLHAVYSAMVRRGEWREFYWWAISLDHVSCVEYEGVAWLFCLNAPEQIPERLKMVVEWIGRKVKP
jgi:hypothetical protein